MYLVKTSPGQAKVLIHAGDLGSVLTPLPDSPDLPLILAEEAFQHARHTRLNPSDPAVTPYRTVDLREVAPLFKMLEAHGLDRLGVTCFIRSDTAERSSVLSLIDYANLTQEEEGGGGDRVFSYRTRAAVHAALMVIDHEEVGAERARAAISECQTALLDAGLAAYGIFLGYRDANDQVFQGIPSPGLDHRRKSAP